MITCVLQNSQTQRELDGQRVVPLVKKNGTPLSFCSRTTSATYEYTYICFPFSLDTFCNTAAGNAAATAASV